MRNYIIRITISLSLVFLVGAKGHCENSDYPNLQKQLTSALQYQRASYTDTATVILRQIIEELTNKKALDTHFGLSTRLHLADVTQSKASDFSSKELLQIIEIGSLQEAWEEVAHAHVLLALAQEFINNEEKCKQHLDQAAFLIEKHQLKTLYPRYAVRRSSYFRIFDLSIDSAYYYASDALKHTTQTATKSKADAYLLLGVLIRNEDDNKAIEYFRKAILVFEELGDYIGQASMITHVTRIYINKNQLDSAMHLNDLARGMLRKMSSSSLYYYPTSAQINLSKANIYKSLGQVDTAWDYLYLSYLDNQQYTEHIKTNIKTLTASEGDYKEQKQAQLLKLEQAQRNGAIVLSLLALIFLAVLSYLYLRLRKANQQNQAQAERLSQLDQAKSRFFANVSHELRTPLTLISGPIQTLLKGKELTPKQRKLLTMADDSGQQLQEMVNEILNLRKLELGRLEIEAKETQLSMFFYRYFVQFESLAERKQIKYSFNIDIDKETVGKIDREKCRQILYNLLSNAFKFTPSGEQIKAQLKLEGKNLQLTVSDTGVGIHPKDLPNVFERYFQTNQPDKAIEGGTGIGLALCYEYVQLFGGKISVDSKLYEGTSFELSFPIAIIDTTSPLIEDSIEKQIAASDKPSETTAIAATNTKAAILVVEDNPALRDYLDLILRPHYKVILAENGQQAWQYLLPNSNNKQTSECQLVLSDLMMPVMDGYQLLEKLKSHDATRHLPVVMLTARSGMRDKLKALRIGVDDYLLKPFEEEELLVRIDNLLQNQAARKATISISTATLKPKQDPPILSEKDQIWLREFEAFVQKNLANPISIATLTKEFAMSESSLLRQLKRLIGLSPKRYLIEIRLEKARKLIENQTYDSIAQVAYETGYTDPKSFSRAFKARFGKLPSAVVNL